MTRIMYDAVTASNIPSNAKMVAGYVNGKYQSYWDLVKLFPNAIHVSIAVSADTDAQVLDCENFDATPQECPQWAVRQWARKQIPTIYCNQSTWSNVISQFQIQAVPTPNYWIANYDDNPVMIPGAISKQYSNTPLFDLSICADYWPGVDAPPQPAPVQTKGRKMVLVRHKGTTYLVMGNGLLKPVKHTQDVQAYNQGGIPGPGPSDISDDEFATYRPY